jgi:hypothetical protein
MAPPGGYFSGMRLDRLRGGDALAGAGGLLLLIAMFLPWFGKVSPFCVPLQGHSCGRNFDAWKAFEITDVILLAAALAGIAVAFFAGSSPKTDAQITSASIAAPVAALATVLVLYRVIDPVGKLDTRYGLYIGLAACAATTYGCWRAIRNDGPSRVARRPRPRSASRTRSPSSSG